MSAVARLLGFVILLALVFLAAYAAGARLGPVTVTHSTGGHGGMNMGLAPAAVRTDGVDG